MKNVVLCGHTGCFNRGCEAIIKSTADLFNEHSMNSILGLHRPKEDRVFGLNEFTKTVYYAEFDTLPLQRVISLFIDKVLHRGYAAAKIRQAAVFKELNKGVAVNVGGDTYCYGEIVARPYIYLNRYCKEKNIPSVLWGCSVDESAVSNHEVLEDLKKYKYIFVRESLSKELLEKAGIPESQVILSADSAFSLRSEAIDLPEGFQRKNMVAFNLSPLVMDCSSNKEVLRNNYRKAIENVLTTTNMGIALIPHVYHAESRDEDISALESLYNEYKDTERVIFFDRFYTCRQLKYIISQCRFLITARTHASIAAYSSNVPTLVLGYSIKARGIAKDLFGSIENFVIPVQGIRQEDEIVNGLRFLIDNEESIIRVLEKKNLEIRKKLDNAVLMVKALL